MSACGLGDLSDAYQAMQLRVACAEGQLQELEDLLCAFFRERDQGAGDWLRALAEVHAADYERRKCELAEKAA